MGKVTGGGVNTEEAGVGEGEGEGVEIEVGVGVGVGVGLAAGGEYGLVVVPGRSGGTVLPVRGEVAETTGGDEGGKVAPGLGEVGLGPPKGGEVVVAFEAGGEVGGFVVDGWALGGGVALAGIFPPREEGWFPGRGEVGPGLPVLGEVGPGPPDLGEVGPLFSDWTLGFLPNIFPKNPGF